MTEVVFMLQALAWPMAAAWIAWLGYRSIQQYAHIRAQESKDQTLTTAAARAEQAIRELGEARTEWAAEASKTTEELSMLKGALIQRS